MIKILSGKIENFQEQEVITVLRAYEYLPNDTKLSARLFGDLNATVVESAVQNKESVDITFLQQYLNQFFMINKRQSNGRDLTRE